MEDLAFLAVLVVFFAVAVAYVRFCDRLSRAEEDER
jgi:hypothetical protein